MAISEACKVISDYLDENPELPRVVNILTDSQATIQALAAQTLDSETVKQCCDNLNTLSETVKVTISWIKAHVQHMGNELADQLAKEGAQSDDPPAMDRYTKSCLKNLVSAHYYGIWSSRCHSSGH